MTRRRCPEAFTLLEVLIALGLIAVALLAVFRLQAQNLDLVSEAQFQTQARFLAQDRLSRIQAKSSIDTGESSGDLEEISPGYSYEQEIRALGEPDGLYAVRVSITRDQGSRKKGVTVDTYLFRPEGK